MWRPKLGNLKVIALACAVCASLAGCNSAALEIDFASPGVGSATPIPDVAARLDAETPDAPAESRSTFSSRAAPDTTARGPDSAKPAAIPIPPAGPTAATGPAILRVASPVDAGPIAVPRMTGSGLMRGAAVHSIPDRMVKDDSTPIDLLMDPLKTPAQLKQELAQMLLSNAHRAARNRGVVLSAQELALPNTELVAESVLIGKKMTAEIIANASDFQISPQGPVDYEYRPGETLRWRWYVKPLRESASGMPLSLKVTADPGSGQSVRVIDRTVIVRSGLTWWQEAARTIEGLLTWFNLVLGGTLAAIGALLKWLFGKGEDGRSKWGAALARFRKKDEAKGSGWFGHA
jgi:hypothetical protein